MKCIDCGCDVLPQAAVGKRCPACAIADAAKMPPPTVKRLTLWSGVVDTFATETELNGFRQSQGRML